jgi:hypothetical protein
MNETDTIAFTIDEDGSVLELIKSDADGVFIRENGGWAEVNTDQEQPTVDDQEWLDTTEAGIAFWDSLSEDERDITREDVLEYTAQSE